MGKSGPRRGVVYAKLSEGKKEPRFLYPSGGGGDGAKDQSAKKGRKETPLLLEEALW